MILDKFSPSQRMLQYEKLMAQRGFQLHTVTQTCGEYIPHKVVYQLLAHGRWFSPGTPASSTPKINRHDRTEILLKVALNTINQSIYLNLDIFVHLGLDTNALLVRSSNQHFIWICIYRDRRDRMVNPTTIQSRPRLPPTIYLKYS